jgi:hypothetical protein
MTGPVTAVPVRALAVAAGVVAPFALVLALDPNQAGHYPTCPVRAYAGVDCPGCGSLRALHDLAQGDVVGALDHNAVMVLLLPLLGIELVRWVRGRPASALVRWRYAPVAALVVLGVWMLARNLPAFPFDVLGSGAWA